MPNYVMNNLTVKTTSLWEKFKDTLCTVSDDGLDANFEKLIPMPKTLNISADADELQCLSDGLAALAAKTATTTLKENANDRQRVIAEIKDHASKWYERNIKLKNAPGFALDQYTAEIFDMNLDNPELNCYLKYCMTCLENLMQYGHATWYSWCIANWGTKWNAMRTKIDDISHSMSFETAWSTPEPIFKALAEKLPEIEFTVEYADEDIGGNTGTLYYKNGELIHADIFQEWSEDSVRFACSVWNYDPDEYLNNDEY